MLFCDFVAKYFRESWQSLKTCWGKAENFEDFSTLDYL